VRINGRIESNQGELLRDATVAGLGISMHSTWHVCEDLRAGRLQIVLPNYPESAAPVQVSAGADTT
jgi:DNA-binding transcriptional LysR family regulator